MQGCASMNGNNNIKLCPGLQQLKNEHVDLLNMLDNLKVSAVSLIEQTTDLTTNFEQLTKDLRTFYNDLAPHSEREEEILFKMMGKYLPPSGGPIEVMEAEHDQARQFIHLYFEEVEKTEQFSDDHIKKLANYTINVHTILTSHFAKEENVLFPMAERMFSAEEKAILNEKLIP